MNRAVRRKQAKNEAKQGVSQNLAQALQQALALLERGQAAQAQALCQQILQHHPNQPDALQLLGVMASQAQRWEEAQTLTLQSLKIKPEQPHAWYNLARIYYMLGAKPKAIEANSNAIKYDPNHVEAYYNRGNSYTEMWEFDKAIADYKAALRIQPDHYNAAVNLALTYKEIQDYDSAIAQLKSVVEAHPDNPAANRSYGLMLREVGDLEQSVAYLRRACELMPDDAEIHYNLSLAQRYKDGANQEHVQQMEALTDRKGVSDLASAYLHFSLAKAYDDAKDDVRAFEHYNKANAAQRKQSNYTTQQVRDYFSRIMEVFDAAYFAKHADRLANDSVHDGAQPVFILGMPRSGTTLVEQILSSHSRVSAAGEQDDIHYVITGNPWESRENYLDTAAGFTAKDFERMAKDYQQRMMRFGKAEYRTDKMPRNFHYIGLIALMMPHAKIIHCTRHPLDTCLSIYKRLFFGSHAYGYDQVELAEHYQLYQQLMKHWHEVLPNRIYNLNYETLVGEPETQIRSLLEHCGLSWEDACLNFHENERSVRTASAAQVRQPLYKDALAGWKRYEPHIQPMIDLLGKEAS